jgi:hypothetical protein
MLMSSQMCHAVDVAHEGKVLASVVYIPSAPSTPANKAYIRQYWKGLSAGIPPDNYKMQDSVGGKEVPMTQNERQMKGALPIESISGSPIHGSRIENGCYGSVASKSRQSRVNINEKAPQMQSLHIVHLDFSVTVMLFRWLSLPS